MKLFETFRLEILETTVCFCIGMTYDEIHKYVEEKHHKDCVTFIEKTKDYGYGKGYFAGYERVKTEEGKHYDFIIYLGTWEFDDYHYTTLAHEAYHITSYLQKIHGIATREWEFLARLHTQIMNEALNIIRKNTKGSDLDIDKKEELPYQGITNTSFLDDNLTYKLTAAFSNEEDINKFLEELNTNINQSWLIHFKTKSQHIWVRLKAHLRERLEEKGFINKETYEIIDQKNNTLLLNIMYKNGTN